MIVQLVVEQTLVLKVEQYLANHNLGNRGIEDGSWQQQRTGLLGECLVHQYLLDSYPDFAGRSNGYDGGFDFLYRGYRVDVKTMSRASYIKPHYVNNVYLLQAKHPADIVVFASLNCKAMVLEICGWVLKSQLPQLGKYYAAGTTRNRADGSSFIFRQNNYEVENRKLLPIASLKNITAR